MISDIALPFSCSVPFTGIVIDFISAYTLFFFGAFAVGLFVSRDELRRRSLDVKEAENVFSISIAGTFIGAKLGYLFEARRAVFIEHTVSLSDIILSPAGLVFYGGLFFTVPILYIYFRLKNRNPLLYADAFTPALALGYGIGRLGCMVSGDGCYGYHAHFSIPPLSTVFGIESLLPSAHVEVWNTPLMESFFSFLFVILFRLKRLPFISMKRSALPASFVVDNTIQERPDWIPGAPFLLYLIWNGVIRFLIEFLRINEPLFSMIDGPQIVASDGRLLPLTYENSVLFGPGPAYFFENYYWHGPTEAQVSSVVLVFISFAALLLRKRNYLHQRLSGTPSSSI